MLQSKQTQLIQRLALHRNLCKIILVSITVALFLSNSAICYLFYDLDKYQLGTPEYELLNYKWWNLRLVLSSSILCLLFIVCRIGNKGWLRFIPSLGIGFSIANIIDRVCFDIHEYTKSDIFMLIATILISAYDSFRKEK